MPIKTGCTSRIVAYAYALMMMIKSLFGQLGLWAHSSVVRDVFTYHYIFSHIKNNVRIYLQTQYIL
jgi:hypothetical protein